MMKHVQYFRVLCCALALMSASITVQAQNPGAVRAVSKEAKIAPSLYQVMQSNGPQAPVFLDGVTVETNQVFKDGKIAIEAVANDGDGERLLNQLKALGLTDGVAYKAKIFGYLPVDRIEQLKNVSSLRYADSYYRPETNTGSVTSQGDAALKADVARATYGVTGAGVKVGVLSDSYNNLGGAAAGVASGDLPAAGVQVLEDLASGGADEGRAMAEIIYDVAPGTAMAFNTAFTGEAGFAQGIINLAAAGCQVIVDDIGYLNAPMFQDGIVAQAVNQVAAGGVTYFSSAANQARSSYQAPYKNGGTYTNAGYFGDNTAYPTHNFGSGTVDNLQQITIPTGGRLRLAFQWDNPYPSISGPTAPAAITDLDILILNSTTGAILASSGRDQLGGGDPWEITGTVTNTTGAPLNVNFVVVKYAGPDPGLIKWVNYGSRTIIPEYDTKSSTSFGHANAASCIGVGASAYFQTPVFNGAATATIEAFSSAGGTPILFNMDGSRINGITGIVRQKPDITSVDGGDNTFFGQDFEPNGKPNFFGTSAAAPHAAGVAALMKQKVPAITPATIRATLQSTALDMDDPSTPGFDTGFDFGTGYGFIQADRALEAIAPANTAPIVANAIPNQVATVGTPFSYVIPTTTFSDAETPNQLTVSVSGLPAGLMFTAPATISGTPSMSGVSTVTVTATDPGNLSASTTFTITVNPASVTPPTGDFAIATVTTISCETVTATERRLTFTPNYTGLTGQPIKFVVVNEIEPTMAPGPYSIRVYIDNPTIQLKATQTGTDGDATFSYNWLAVCNGTPTADVFAIAAVTTISCETVTATERRLTFTPEYTGLTGQPIKFVVINEIEPTMAPGPYSIRVYIDNPTIKLKATQTGTSNEANFVYNWLAVCNATTPTPPPADVFAITAVTTISCQTVTATERRLTFTPEYTGLTGQPIKFVVVNEIEPTMAPGPYSIRVYIDNPTIRLRATQTGTQGDAVFTYNWLALCTSSGSARRGAEPEQSLSVRVLGNPVVDNRVSLEVSGAVGKSLRLTLTDMQGKPVGVHAVDQAESEVRHVFDVSRQPAGMLLLRASTPDQTQTIRVLKTN